MSVKGHKHNSSMPSATVPCCGRSEENAGRINRREFVASLGATAALSGAAMTIASHVRAASPKQTAASDALAGAALRVKPVLVYQIAQRREFTSWRPYGGLHTRDDVDKEAERIKVELKNLSSKSEFAMEILPLSLVGNDAEATAAAGSDCDTLLVYASGGNQGWLETLAASGKPNVMFVRHKSGPVYLWYEIAHWRFLRKSEDTIKEPNMDVWDIVVDDYDDVLWRLRALHGLKNALGTKVIAIGGLKAYSKPGQERGPAHAQAVWKFDIKSVSNEEMEQRLKRAGADESIVQEVQRQTNALLSQKNLTLATDRKFIVNTFMALRVFKDIMAETGATNLGVADCMGGLIRRLDTPPCLALSILNDEGYTAFCHTDFTHTPAGVLLHHISGKPSFVSNSHFPHHGMITLAHCAAPRKMNGKEYEPTKILTHFESDYGAATKVEYTKGQTTTNLIPNLVCTKWFGFRGKIVDSPSYDMCRSQMDVEIDGDWQKLLTDMQGFHTITCYGDYLREVGYALKKLGIEWQNISERT